MGSILDDVLHLMHHYETGEIKGAQVSFGKTGIYYSAEYGENWFEYFFEPICLGDMSDPIKYISGAYYPLHWNKKREDHSRVVRTYIIPKKYIQDTVNEFVIKRFRDYFIIGVHYRGTDKRTEAGRVSYEKMIISIRNRIAELQKIGINKYKIFLATDEQQFLELMIKEFPKKVRFTDAYRSDNEFIAVHHGAKDDHYKCGKDAVLDMLLLSKCNYLIRTESNLSRWSLYFNKDLQSDWISQ